MKLVVNGETREVAEGITVLALLEELDLQPEATVVERNGEIVERARFAETVLTEADCLELVRFVGGG